jgi:hypothetical protein
MFRRVGLAAFATVSRPRRFRTRKKTLEAYGKDTIRTFSGVAAT